MNPIFLNRIHQMGGWQRDVELSEFLVGIHDTSVVPPPNAVVLR
jgi:hypothetical protein